MTSDTKIGLLLGLVFIFVIAFVINGLPNLSKKPNSTSLTKEYLTELQSSQVDITSKARQAAEIILAPVPVRNTADDQTHPSVPSEERSASLSPAADLVPAGSTPSQPSAASPQQSVAQVSDTTKMLETASCPPPRLYVVQEGDNLLAIAKKCYGPEAGKKKASLDKIFQANQQALKSPDKIYEGQKLVIPPLDILNEAAKKNGLGNGETMFEKVKSISRAPLSIIGRADAKPAPAREYVVEEGDSLWSIAQHHLKDGCRYTEIAALNQDILKDQDNIAVGMHLKLPRE